MISTIVVGKFYTLSEDESATGDWAGSTVKVLDGPRNTGSAAEQYLACFDEDEKWWHMDWINTSLFAGATEAEGYK